METAKEILDELRQLGAVGAEDADASRSSRAPRRASTHLPSRLILSPVESDAIIVYPLGQRPTAADPPR